MSIAIRSLRPCSGFTEVESSDSALLLSGNGVLMPGIPFWTLFATAGRSPQIGLVGLGEIAIGWFLLG